MTQLNKCSFPIYKNYRSNTDGNKKSDRFSRFIWIGFHLEEKIFPFDHFVWFFIIRLKKRWSLLAISRVSLMSCSILRFLSRVFIKCNQRKDQFSAWAKWRDSSFYLLTWNFPYHVPWSASVLTTTIYTSIIVRRISLASHQIYQRGPISLIWRITTYSTFSLGLLNTWRSYIGWYCLA